jgi:DNA-directed RNA polymerase subunit M/transcription elongation factor TFIIS
MYYIKLDEENPNDLQYYCRKCGDINKDIASDAVIVSKTYIHKNNTNLNQYMNQYTKLDPTLPRIKNIKCPNHLCITNRTDTDEADADDSASKSVDNEVIYIRYDNVNLKYIYMCVHCDHIWNMSNS